MSKSSTAAGLAMLLFLLCAVSLPQSALACRCKDEAFEANLNWSSFVFQGTLLKLEIAKKAPFLDTFVFQVTRCWKGNVSGVISMYSTGSSCGLKTGGITKIGQSYLIYAKKSGTALHRRAGFIMSRQCHRVGLASSEQAQGDIKTLNDLHPPPSRKLPAPAVAPGKASLPKDMALLCAQYGKKIGTKGMKRRRGMEGMFVFNFQSDKPQLLMLANFGGGDDGWGQGAQRIDKIKTSPDRTMISFRAPGHRGLSGTRYQMYLKGQQSQRVGGKYAGKILVFGTPYKVPPDPHLLPKLLVCQSAVFP